MKFTPYIALRHLCLRLNKKSAKKVQEQCSSRNICITANRRVGSFGKILAFLLVIILIFILFILLKKYIYMFFGGGGGGLEGF